MKLQFLSDLEKLLPPSEKVSSSEGKRKHDGRGATVHISLETKGRNGKSVTLVSGLQHNPATMKVIARILKEHCGVGGTVKDRKIELQGDQRERAKANLEKMNYTVK